MSKIRFGIHSPRASRTLKIGAVLTGCAASFAAAALFGFRAEDAMSESPKTRLYMDVHRLGPGEVTAEAVAGAHQKDLEIQDDFAVDYQRYWVDEAEGNVYCLVRAPSPAAAEEVHRRAHGLVADEIVEMAEGILPSAGTGERPLFLDTHEAGPGGVTAEAVAEAHREDLAVQDEFGVSFLEYWLDEESGRIHCLAEAPSEEAVIEAHAKAHGLVPDEIHRVAPGQ